jgi:hypothetical protein
MNPVDTGGLGTNGMKSDVPAAYAFTNSGSPFAALTDELKTPVIMRFIVASGWSGFTKT